MSQPLSRHLPKTTISYSVQMSHPSNHDSNVSYKPRQCNKILSCRTWAKFSEWNTKKGLVEREIQTNETTSYAHIRPFHKTKYKATLPSQFKFSDIPEHSHNSKRQIQKHLPKSSSV